MDKKRKGLGALIPNVAWRGREEPVRELAVAAIQPNPYQPRQQEDGAQMEELMASIREHGIVQPLVVCRRGDSYQLVAGQRRLAAARLVGLLSVPVVVRACSDREVLELALVENLQREDLNPLEAAQAYQRLLSEFGLSQEQVAQRVGKSRSAVANTLRLLQLPAPMQDSLRAGRLSEGHGRALLAVADAQRQRQLWQWIEQRSLSVRQAEALSQAAPARPARRSRRLDPNLEHLESRLRRALGTKVTLRPRARGQGGSIEIAYYSADDLERLCQIMEQEQPG